MTTSFRSPAAVLPGQTTFAIASRLTLCGLVALAFAAPGVQAQEGRSRFGPQGGAPSPGQGTTTLFNTPRITTFNPNGNRVGGVGSGAVNPFGNRGGANGTGYGYNGFPNNGYNSGFNYGTGYGFNGYSYGPGYGQGGFNNGYNGYNNYYRSNPGLLYPNLTPQQYTNGYTRASQYVPGGIRSEDYLRGTQFRYNNGVYGRGNFRTYAGFGGYFPGSAAYYPYYSTTYSPFGTYYSPYASYLGVFPPYISSSYVAYSPPEYIYVPYPVYVNDNFTGWRNPESVDDYYLNGRRSQSDSDYQVNERDAQQKADAAQKADAERAATSAAGKAVADALGDIRHAWQDRDIQQIAKHTRRDTKIAVYLRGKYQYSLSASDYLDLTRDAFRATTTVRFELETAQRRENGVYSVTGRHIYKDKSGEEKTVFVSYVLEKKDGEYIITQIGTAPQKNTSVLDAPEPTTPEPAAPAVPQDGQE